MIKANELRLGNWVDIDKSKKYDWHNSYLKITELTTEIAHWESVDDIEPQGRMMSGSYYKDLNPIPLMPEIFEQAGFIQPKGFEYYRHKEDDGEAQMRYLFLDGGVVVSMGDNANGILFNKIRYVHELQNIHFFNTGIELTINL